MNSCLIIIYNILNLQYYMVERSVLQCVLKVRVLSYAGNDMILVEL